MTQNRIETMLVEMPIIAILRGVQPDECAAVGEALVSSGIRLIEVTLNSPDALTSIERLSRCFSDYASIGAGTVLTPTDIRGVANAGGQFIVSPNTNPDVIEAAISAGLTSVPGIMTPTDAFTSIRSGATTLKIFPAGVVGPEFIKALSSVLPAGVGLCAVGGVGNQNALQWFKTGIKSIGVGSELYRPGNAPSVIAEKAETLVKTVRSVIPSFQ